MVEVLRSFGDLRFRLDRLLERAYSGVRWDIEREEVCICMRWSSDSKGDPPEEARC